MKPFNREKFLLWLLAALLGWQASIFTYATVKCASVKQPMTMQDTCPNLAENYSKFVQVTLGAVLGLLAGSVTQRQASFSGNRDESLASQAPVKPQPITPARTK